MKTRFLFPHFCKKIGIVLTVVFMALGIAHLHFEFTIPLELPAPSESIFANELNRNNGTDELAMLGVILGLMLTAFSREKSEDEYITQLRLDSLQWAVYINYLLLALAVILVYGGLFMDLIIYNLYTVLIIFILRFNVLLYRYLHAPEPSLT